MRHKKREEYMQKKRNISDAPFLIALVPLNSNIETASSLLYFKNCDSTASTAFSPEAHLHVG